MTLDEIVCAYKEQGVVLLPGIFADWVPHLADGIEKHLSDPGPNACEHVPPGEDGRFFEDYLNWDRVAQYRSFVFESGVGMWGARLMQSINCQLFADHVFVKEPHTTKPTPWHQDASYSPFGGVQSINAWVAIDRINRDDGLHFIPGSHLWDLTLPSRSFDTGHRYKGASGTDPGAIDFDQHRLVSWDLTPGDALFFDSRTLHGTIEKGGLPSRRRAICIRMVGDDVRYLVRSGIPSFPWQGLVSGEKLPESIFPLLYSDDVQS
jgi:ectoine hydroxylase-related dioxygenase (phytanoyl-CoA dioxygenase family)